MKSKLIGQKVYVKDNVPQWGGFWGYIKDFDGDNYHIGGGAIGDNLTPTFSRNEFVVKKNKK